MMSCLLHAADALPADPNSGSVCAPYSSSDNICPGFGLEFRALERDYMGLGLGLEPQPADPKNIPLTAHLTKQKPAYLAETSPHDDLCGIHLKLAPPYHGADDREGDADDCGEDHLSANNVGWPPISSYRRTTTRGLSMKPPCSAGTITPLIVHAAPLEDATATYDGDSDARTDDHHEKDTLIPIMQIHEPSLPRKAPLHIKVSMDGTPIMRKVNLKSMQGYHHLSLELLKLFKFCRSGLSSALGVHSYFKDLSGARFLLTYQDRDGDWMLVGDMPWETFARSARRIRIMKKAK